MSNSDGVASASVFAEPVSVLLAEPDEPVPWIVEGLFAEGAHGWIGAEPKVGKSWLGLDLAMCVALGRSFLGYDVRRPFRVLYVQEDRQQKARPHHAFASFCVDMAATIQLRAPRSIRTCRLLSARGSASTTR